MSDPAHCPTIRYIKFIADVDILPRVVKKGQVMWHTGFVAGGTEYTIDLLEGAKGKVEDQVHISLFEVNHYKPWESRIYTVGENGTVSFRVQASVHDGHFREMPHVFDSDDIPSIRQIKNIYPVSWVNTGLPSTALPSVGWFIDDTKSSGPVIPGIFDTSSTPNLIWMATNWWIDSWSSGGRIWTDCGVQSGQSCRFGMLCDYGMAYRQWRVFSTPFFLVELVGAGTAQFSCSGVEGPQQVAYNGIK